MFDKSTPPYEPFEHFRFLWDEIEKQSWRLSAADEIMEDGLRMLLYVDDWESLSNAAQKLIQVESEKLKKAEHSTSLVKNAVGQALIIGVSNAIKIVSEKLASARLGPLVPLSNFPERGADNNRVYWVCGVRAASNYVRHAGEWKREAYEVRSATGRDPELADFKRGDTRNNLTVLGSLFPHNLADLVKYDLSYDIADRLQLTSADSCVRMFEELAQEANASL